MFICDAGYISDGVYMGSAPCPQVRRYRYSGSRTQSEGRKLFGSPQAPYLRWRVFGSCPSPGVYMGSAPCPQDRTLPLFGEPNPIKKTQAVWESPSPISPMACIWENAQAPRCIWGEPHTPKDRTLPLFGRSPNPNQEDASCLGVPKPHISDGVYLGVAQAPRCIWGVPHAPKTGRCRYSGECPNPNFHFSLFTF